MSATGRGREMARRGGSDLERLPQSLLYEILSKLDLESLCSTAPVSKTLHFSAYQALSSLSTINLSGFPPDAEILNHVLHDNKVLKSLTLDCSHLDNSSISILFQNHLEELVLLNCSLSPCLVFTSIAEKCRNLRVFTLEMAWLPVFEPSETCKENLRKMIKGCLFMESLCIKFRGPDCNRGVFESIEHCLPKTIKSLNLRPMSELQARQLILETRSIRSSVTSSFNSSIHSIDFRLQSLSLVLDTITDELLTSITCNLSFLVELDLEDKPKEEPSSLHDLTNDGLQSLGSCSHLRSLSLVRSREFFRVAFKRVNDMGIFLLAEGSKKLESIKLGGFSRVSDAGFASILDSCKSLKKFEVFNAYYLSDLAFHDLVGSPCSLVDVRLFSCGFITSEAMENLSLCRRLEVLDLGGCKSIADRGLSSISSLTKLTTLNLMGADVTDSGMSILGREGVPIVSLLLRGCKRVTDRGVSFLLHGGGMIRKTLKLLDISYMPGISDRAIFTIADAATELTDLCIRHCFYVTDTSIAVLASKRGYGKGCRPLRRLDLYLCSGLSINLIQSLKRPSFCGLRWLGIRGTCLLNMGDAGIKEISSDRPGLHICLNGCELGCYGGCAN